MSSMFSSALKSISSTNISSNYAIQPQPTSAAGPWRIYDAKKKSTGKPHSVFVFDRKATLDAHAGSLPRSAAGLFRKAADEVVDRLRREALALARLRHPCILELVEPVEDTRGGGLQFVTEAVSASLASLLHDKDAQGRASRHVVHHDDGARRRRDLDIDELEVQKGLLQVSKALEFLHDNAGLVHCNLTPDSILVNAKGDWKIAGLSFCSPPENSTKPTSFQPINLGEALHMDPRLPQTVQLDLDYASPDLVIDHSLTPFCDMFSLGLVCIALYNAPRRSPLQCNASLSTYKRIFQSSSTTPSASNDFLCSQPIPKYLSNQVLPRLITRRAAQRMTDREFQNSEFFNNVLVNTIRFIDDFPAKTPNEKAQFLRGLVKVLPSFPKSVMEKKVLPALLEEMKDRELLSLILHNVFKIVGLLPSGRRAFGDKIRPSLREIFVTNVKNPLEKDTARDASLMIILEQLAVIAANCDGKEFRDDILPIVFVALESPTPSVVDAALKSIPLFLQVLDFGTIKNDVFPVVAAIFSKTNSLAIKIRGLQAFVVLCGGSSELADSSSDGLDGLDGLSIAQRKTASSSCALDRYTMQEKIVPLIKAIRTKEPAVMVATLRLLRVIGEAADADFVATEILPILWSMSLGPLLDLRQFQQFMALVKSLSARVEDEQTKKLQELGVGGVNGVAGGSSALNDDFMALGAAVGGSSFDANGTTEGDFQRLVNGSAAGGGSSNSMNPMDSGWDAQLTSSSSVASVMNTRAAGPPPGGVVASSNPWATAGAASAATPTFSWSTPAPETSPASQLGLGSVGRAASSSFRTVTPDSSSLARFEALSPSSTQFSRPLQPTGSASTGGFQSSPAVQQQQQQQQLTSSTAGGSSLGWGAAAAVAAANPWASPMDASSSASPMMGGGAGRIGPSAASQLGSAVSAFGSMSLGGGGNRTANGSGSGGSSNALSSFSLPPPPQNSGGGASSMMGSMMSAGGMMSAGMGAVASGRVGVADLKALGAMASGVNSMNNMLKSNGLGGGVSMGSMMGAASSIGGMMGGLQGLGQGQGQGQPGGQQGGGQAKSGLDKYASLL